MIQAKAKAEPLKVKLPTRQPEQPSTPTANISVKKQASFSTGSKTSRQARPEAVEKPETIRKRLRQMPPPEEDDNGDNGTCHYSPSGNEFEDNPNMSKEKKMHTAVKAKAMPPKHEAKTPQQPHQEPSTNKTKAEQSNRTSSQDGLCVAAALNRQTTAEMQLALQNSDNNKARETDQKTPQTPQAPQAPQESKTPSENANDNSEDEDESKKKLAKVQAKKQAHARYMRFSRSLKSFLVEHFLTSVQFGYPGGKKKLDQKGFAGGLVTNSYFDYFKDFPSKKQYSEAPFDGYKTCVCCSRQLGNFNCYLVIVL